MTINRHNIIYPAQGRGFSLLARFAILALDILAIFLLCITTGLYYTWSKRSKSYYNEDWQDPMVIGVLIISLVWTGFVCLRPAWKNSLLHPGHYVAWELISWLFILGCLMPAFVLSSILFGYGGGEFYDRGCDRDNDYYSSSTSWEYSSREKPLKGVNATAYLFALIVT